ncbi:MAG: hypothetical protein HY938_02665 [Nitrosomonadales bacterium]|nr:hypothetical protein [Nitrosomonadales bacterium]
MNTHFALATIFAGAVFSMNSFAEVIKTAEDKKARTTAARFQPLEDIADIHNSPVITAHPTRLASNEASVAELRKLRRAGEARERHLRAQYRSRGLVYPARFEGD